LKFIAATQAQQEIEGLLKHGTLTVPILIGGAASQT
jgi:hypothetical protein